MTAVNNLKKYRKIANLTLNELAQLAGTTQGSLSNYEVGKITPPIKTALSIINALNGQLKELNRQGYCVKPNLSLDKIWTNGTVNKGK